MTTKHNSLFSPVVIVALLLGAIVSTLFPALPASAQQANPIFPLEGSPSEYTKGTKEVGGKGYHCDKANITCGWDYWRPDQGSAVVLAAISGTVKRCGDIDGVGNPVVTIENSDWEVGYLHMERIDAACGSKVTAGTPIGLTGNIGQSDWNHLHFWAKNLVTGQFDESQNWPIPVPHVSGPAPQASAPQVLGLPTQDLSQIPLPILIGIGLAIVFALGLANQRTRGVAALSLLVIIIASLGWLTLHAKVEQVIAAIPTEPPPAVSQPTPDNILSQKGAANHEGWQIIKQAVSDADGDANQAELLYWTWQSETAVVDCTPWKEKFEADGFPNLCVSKKAFAKGPFQFMDGTWAKYEDKGWDKWTLYGATRGAYEEFTKLNLWGYTDAPSFATRFSGGDGGKVWNNGNDGYNQALAIFNNWLSYDPPN